MIQEMQKDQKPEEVQIRFKEYVDRGSVQKTRTSVHERKAKCKATQDKRVQTKTRLTVNSRGRQPRKGCQKCVENASKREQEGSARHVDRSILAHISESRRAR